MLETADFCETCFIGTRRGLEAKVVQQQAMNSNVWISGLKRGRFAANLLFL